MSYSTSVSTQPRAKPEVVGLSVQEFFARKIPGFTMQDAHLATRISYSTVHALATGRREPRRQTLRRLVEWSRGAAAGHGVCISGARSLGLDDDAAAKGSDSCDSFTPLPKRS